MNAQFVNYNTAHARKHAGNLDPEQDARLFVEPESIDESPERLKKLRRNISDVHNATCNAFASLGLPLKLRALVPVILAAYCHDKEAAEAGSTTFKASYTTLVGLLFRQGDGRTFEAKKSEVRRLLDALEEWQEGNTTLCTIRRGGKTKDQAGRDEFHETEFDLVLLDGLAKAMMRNPEPERMRAAVRMEVAEMMKLPPFDGRWQVKPPPLDKLRDQDRKAALTKAAKAVEATEKLNGDPLAYAEALAAEIVRQAREKYGETSYKDEAEESPSVENAEVEAQGGVSNPTHPDTPPEAPEAEPDVQEVAPIRKEHKVLYPDPPPRAEPDQKDVDAWNKTFIGLTNPQPFGVTNVNLVPPDLQQIADQKREAARLQAIRTEPVAE